MLYLFCDTRRGPT
uniref:Uncharacterized protein n=1 Tax=Arundo donax TaxID=35708 RepID=A0A0A8YJV3_ARUDO